MADCYLFNPSSEIALGLDSKSFTPTAAVKRFERELMLLPALYAPEGAAILLSYPMSHDELAALPYFDIARKKGMSFIKPGEHIPAGCRLIPWGWNRATATRAAKEGFLYEAIPSTDYLTMIRRFAHRAVTIDLWSAMQPEMDLPAHLIPREARSIAEALEIIGNNPDGWVAKAPWSSSGRGVVFTRSLSETLLTRRLDNTIRRHGSILLEPDWDKAIDFATEWNYDDGHLDYLGISLFKSSGAGNYNGNIVAGQTDLLDVVANYCNNDALSKTIELQRRALIHTLAPLFHAHDRQPALPPLLFGIDMLADRQRRLNPCVELNLRHTMGHVAIDLYEAFRTDFTFIPGEPIPAEHKNNV